MVVYLTGFMGSGKTTTGRALARLLGYRFVDLDALIVERQEMPITEIFAQKGEDYFRQMEHSVLGELSRSDDIVIGTGGGTPCFSDNMRLMNDTGLTIYLKLDVPVLAKRLSRGKSSRPLIAGLDDEQLVDFIGDLLSKREAYYMQSKIICDAFNLNAGRLLDIIKTQS